MRARHSSRHPNGGSHPHFAAVLLLILITAMALPGSSGGQTPPDDPYLGVPILTGGAPAPGSPVTVVNHGVITRTGDGIAGITASSTTGGYSADVLNGLRNFSDAAFSYVTTGVRNPDGSAGTVGQPVAGTLIDENGNALSGSGGSFTLAANGGFQFVPSADFNDLVDGLQPNQSVRTSVAFTVVGTNTATAATKESVGTLVVTVSKGADGAVTRSIGAAYDDFGSSRNPDTKQNVFPDLKAYVTSLLQFSYRGGPGSAVNVVNDGAITTAGVGAHGMDVNTQGQRGSDGRDASLFHSSSMGSSGGAGGAIAITANGTIATCEQTSNGCVGADQSVGVLATSVGGNGGTGGDSGWTRSASSGGPGANGAAVTVAGNGTISTGGALSSGILAFSQGGDGGAGGGGSTFNGAANGANGGAGGTVIVNGSWNIETWGNESHGIFAKSLGGVAGSGGNGGWTGTSSGGGGLGTWGGSVTVVSDGTIKTHGDASHGIYAWSEGGAGGAGGSGTSIFYASGGSGSGAGSGGSVSVTNDATGWIETWGSGSHGIFAQSIGGGGGSGGTGKALVGFGGGSESGGDGGAVTVFNQGTITAHGAGSRGIYAQSVGGGGGDGGNSYGLASFGGQGSKTSNGGTVAIANTGTISSTADAIFAQSIGGGGGNGGSSKGWFSFGGQGGAGGDAAAVTVSSHGNLTTTEINGNAIFAESLGGGGGKGGNSTAVGSLVTVAIGGSGAAGGAGSDVRVGVDPETSAIDPVTGVLQTGGVNGANNANGIFAQSVGGGGGSGGFAVSVAAGVPDTGASVGFAMGGSGGGGNDAANTSVYFGDAHSSITTKGANSNGIFAQSVGGGGGSGGSSIAAAVGGFSAGISLGGNGGTGGDGGTVTVGSTLFPLLGTITTSGPQSYGVLAQSVGKGGGNGGLSVSGNVSLVGVNFSIGGKGAGGGDASTVDVVSNSTITTSGANSHALFAQSAGGGGGSGGLSIGAGASATGDLSLSFGGTAGGGGNAGEVTLVNQGTVTTTGYRADGIHAQSVGGGGGDGGFSIAAGASQVSLNFGFGGNGGNGGTGADVTVTNGGEISTSGQQSHGLFAHSVGGGGGSGGFALSGSFTTMAAVDFALGGKGGTGGDSGVVTVTNTGSITTGGDHATGNGSYGIDAQSIGGGGGSGGFAGTFSLQFSGTGGDASLSVGVGGNGGGAGDSKDVTVTNSGKISTTADSSYGVYAQSIGGGGGDAGFGLNVTLAASAGANASAGVAVGGNGGKGGNGAAVTVTNSNTITTSGNHSQGIKAESVGGGGGDGGASISLVGSMGFSSSNSASVSVGGKGSAAGDGRHVAVTNDGSIETSGDDSAAIQAQSIGGGGGNGGASLSASLAGPPAKTFSVSVGGSGGGGGIGGQVDVFGSSGSSLVTHGAGSDGIEAQSVGGGGGNGGSSAALAFGVGNFSDTSATISSAVGGHGGTGNVGGAVNVGTAASALRANITTEGEESIGILAQSIGGGGGNGGSSVSGSLTVMPARTGPNIDLSLSVGGSAGIGNDGGDVQVNHLGTIDTRGAGSHGIEAQSIGGGGGNGGSARALNFQLAPSIKNTATKNFTVTASVGGSGAAGSDGGAVTVANVGDITTRGGGAYGIFAHSIGGGGGTAGDGHLGAPGLGDDAFNFVFGQSSFLKNVKFVVGGTAGASGNGGAVGVSNTGAITTFGDGSTAVFAQSVGGGGGVAGGGTADPGLGLGLLTLAAGGGGGAAGNGGAVTVSLGGSARTYGAGASGIFAQSVGGGGGIAGGVDRGVIPGTHIGIGWGPALGQAGGSGGDGGTVTVNSTADIWTRGQSSTGIVAQSVGGGGGVVGGMTSNLYKLDLLNFFGSVGGTGSGGEVSVTQAANITTLGDSADGIFAQSAGGKADDKGAGGFGDAVSVTVNGGNILAMGAGSDGIFAQSLGQAGNGNVSVNILNANSIVAGGSGGAAVQIADGGLNTIINYGTLTNVNGIAGTTVVGGAGHDTLRNWGTVMGSIDLGAGNNAFINEASGSFIGGDRVSLGAGNVFENRGTLSLGGIGQLQTTNVAGNFTQSGTPRWVVDIDDSARSDALIVSGSAQLGGSATIVDLNEIEMPTGSGSYTLLSAGSGLRGADFRFGTMYGAMPVGLTFGFATSDTREALTVSPSTGPFYWTGGVGSSWTSPFVNGVAHWRTSEGSQIYGTPGSASDVFVTSSGASSMGADFIVNSLTFTGGVSHTLADTHTLTIMGGNGTGVSANGAVTLDLNLELGASQTWWNGGSLVVNGANIGGAGRNLVVDGPGTTLITAAINTATGSLTKVGEGTLILRGANVYTGGTFVTAGTLVGDSTSIQGSVRNDTTVVFDQPWAGTYAGAMSGAGVLEKQGLGALGLAGNSQAFTGMTIVGAGQLFVNGILGGKWLDVQPGAMLGGNGVVSNTTVERGAVLSAGNSTVGRLFVNGDLRLEPGAIYRVKTEAYGSSDLTIVAGQLSLDGATLDVQAGGTRRYRPINLYRIFDVTGGVKGTFSGVTTNLPYLDPSLQFDGGGVDLTLRRNDVDFRTMGTQGNQTSVAGALNSLVRTATGDLAAVVNNIYDLPNNQALGAMSSMSGLLYQYSARNVLDVSRSFTAAALQRLGVVARGTRGTLRNTGFDVGTPTTGPESTLSDVQYGAWATGIGGTTRYRGTASDAAAKAHTVGLVGGFDRALTNTLSLGFSAGQGWPGLTVDGTPDRESATFTHVGAYGRYADRRTRVDVAIGYSHIDRDVFRSMTDGVNIAAATARNYGNGFAVQVEYGRLVDVTRAFSVEPTAGLQAGAFRQNAFVESGGNVLALAVPSSTAQSERMLLGSRFAFVPRQSVTMEARGAWAHEFRRLDDVLVHFDGDPYATTFPISPSTDLRNSALLGVGLGINAGPRLRLFVDFGGEVGGASRVWSGTIGLMRTW